MKDKYLIIYKNSVCVIRQRTVSKEDLSVTIKHLINNQNEILTISKCWVSE